MSKFWSRQSSINAISSRRGGFVPTPTLSSCRLHVIKLTFRCHQKLPSSCRRMIYPSSKIPMSFGPFPPTSVVGAALCWPENLCLSLEPIYAECLSLQYLHARRSNQYSFPLLGTGGLLPSLSQKPVSLMYVRQLVVYLTQSLMLQISFECS